MNLFACSSLTKAGLDSFADSYDKLVWSTDQKGTAGSLCTLQITHWLIWNVLGRLGGTSATIP